MNKTVNINLAGIFFHIDEDAYLKLKRYLETIKRSFTNSQGGDEILADIEARIAELFSEKIKDKRQVINMEQVDEVITIMGQPEDYHVDEDLFEDEVHTQQKKKRNTPKQLFRDTENAYIGGVSSGLGHYLGIDTVWLRLAWVLFTIFSSGAFIFIYIAFWIFVPEAVSTADQLAMKGEPININTIEKKIKEGFDGISDTVKNVDYEKYGKKVKSGSATFFDAIGDIFLFILKVFVKFIGGLLIFTAGATLIALFISLFTIGSFDFIDTPWTEYIEVTNFYNTPIWLVTLLVLFAVGIPFFFLFILGLKILIKNLKSIGTVAKLSLLALWILSIIGLSVIGLRQMTLQAFDEKVVLENEIVSVTPQDTLYIKMNVDSRFVKNAYNRDSFKIKTDHQGRKVIVFQDIELFLKSSKTDTLPKIQIAKSSEGSSYDDAREKAEAIEYNYKIEGNTLYLDAHALTAFTNHFRDQEVQVFLSIPEGMTLFMDDNTSYYNNSWTYKDYIPVRGKEDQYIQLKDDTVICNDCPKNETNKWKYEEWEENTEDHEPSSLKIDTDKGKVEIKINEEKEGLDIEIQ
ncbi:PspC domain-containing protein [Aquimarina rhabdastrellae]